MTEPMSEATMTSLNGLRVVEFAGSVAGAYCARMFAIQGASVTVIGRGDLTEHQTRYLRRWTTAMEQDVAETGASIDWTEVDVVIESSATSRPERHDLDAPHLVRVRLSPFGESGPRASWRSSDLVDYAVSGHAYLYGDPEREPLRGPPDQPAIATGLFGFIGAMAALFARATAGGPAKAQTGQTVEANHHQVMVALHQMTLLRWMLSGDLLRRMGNRYTGQGQPNGPYQCRDGWISIVGVTDPQVEGLLAVTGLTHLMDRPDISSPMDFQARPELLDEPLKAWLANESVDDVVELFQAMRIPTCPLRTPLELLDDPQLIARSFLVPVADEAGAESSGYVEPGAPFTITRNQDPAGGAWQPEHDADNPGPLAGLRVLDLARVWAGPLCARILSDLGADVVWVEAPFSRGPRELPQSFIDATRYFPDNEAGDRPWNRNGHITKFSLGKKSLAIDLQHADGKAAFERLVPHAHVLLENFSSRVMPQFGLGEDRLHELNPDLIYLTMPGYGRSGPAEHWLAYGSCVDSHAGLSSLIGYPGESPWKGGVAWPDPIAGLHACSALLAHLWASSTGAGGCTIEAAQFESTLAAIGDRMIEAQSGAPFVPRGNDDPTVPLQGMFRCSGPDAWLAVTVADARAEHALRTQFGAPSTPLHTLVTELAAPSDAATLAIELQAIGVAAAPAMTAPQVMADEHLSNRAAWVTVDQPDIGSFTVPAIPLSFSRSRLPSPAPAPALGEHNRPVLLARGFTSAEVAALEDTGVVVSSPPG